MKTKAEEKKSFADGFAAGIKANNEEWLDILAAKIKYYKFNKNSGKGQDRLSKVSVLEELKKEME